MKTMLKLAGAVILNPAGEVLLLHRNTSKRVQWEIPGGKIDPGESETDTTIREIREELTCGIEIIKPLGAKEFTDGGFTMHYTWFLARVIEGVPAVGEPDTFDGLRYFSQADLQANRDELSGNTRNFLDAWTSAEFTLTHN
jgi:8-oxo-dGTP pyrophosphatase MutT (NUDIX family)